MTTDLLILQALRHSTLTEELRDAEIDALAKLITVRDFKAGDVLVQPSEASEDTLLILGSGEVEADAVVGNDKMKLHLLKPGDLAGIIGFVGGSATQVSATVVAKTDGKMLLLDRVRFETLLNNQPAIVYYVMRGIIRHVHGIVRRMNLQSVEMSKYIYKLGSKY
ncbi:MAG: cyclic nucleotide-binding domain-containing protein [Gallionellaceae bacterium]|nr:cyclic nucleotide-binding domain-containing protein [Gallionellaceae bacterium]